MIVNAAYRQSDWATTADGGLHVALAAAATGARLVHVSSDAVFSGARTFPGTAVVSGARASAENAVGYDEADTPDPIALRSGQGRRGDRGQGNLPDRPNLPDHR